MKILLAVDGSDYTQRMLEYVAGHAELFGKAHECTAITVVPPLPPQVTHFIDRQTIEAYRHDEAEKALQPVRAFAAQQGWKLDELRPVGHAGDVIAEFAQQGKFDLVLMGSHGHGSLGGLVLGSVVSRVLARCGVPLLIIR